MYNAVPSKLPRHHFRCFECRAVFPQKDGDWFDRGSMQVHLCRTCEQATLKGAMKNGSTKTSSRMNSAK